MSNRNGGENPPHRKPKVSLAMTIIQGLGGPNRVPEKVLGMDSWLIFQPPYCFLINRRRSWRESIIGFAFCSL